MRKLSEQEYKTGTENIPGPGILYTSNDPVLKRHIEAGLFDERTNKWVKKEPDGKQKEPTKVDKPKDEKKPVTKPDVKPEVKPKQEPVRDVPAQQTQPVPSDSEQSETPEPETRELKEQLTRMKKLMGL